MFFLDKLNSVLSSWDWKFESLNKQLDSLEDNDFVRYRSRIICEALRIHIKAIKEYLNLPDSQRTLPQEYKKLLNSQLFILKDDGIQVPTEIIKNAATLCKVEIDYDSKDAYELTKLFYVAENEQSKLCKKIAELSYNNIRKWDDEYNDLMSERFDDYVKVDLDSIFIENSDNWMLYFPIIEFDNETLKDLYSLVGSFYDIIENNKLGKMDKFIENYQEDYFNNDWDQHEKCYYPGVVKLPNTNNDNRFYNYYYPIIEIIIHIISEIINDYTSRAGIQNIVLSLNIVEMEWVLREYLFEDDDKTNSFIVKIENIVSTLRNKISTQKENVFKSNIVELYEENANLKKSQKANNESNTKYIEEFEDMVNLKIEDVHIFICFEREEIIIKVGKITAKGDLNLLDLIHKRQNKDETYTKTVFYGYIKKLIQFMSPELRDLKNLKQDKKLDAHTSQFNAMMRSKFPIGRQFAVKKPKGMFPKPKFKLKVID